MSNKIEQKNQIQLQCMQIEMEWQSLADSRNHIDDLIKIFDQETIFNIKLPYNSAQEFMKELKQNMSCEQKNCGMTKNQFQMVLLLLRKDLIIINAAQIIEQILFELIKFTFDVANLSLTSLQKQVFQIVQVLPPDMKQFFQKYVLSEAMRQLELNDVNQVLSVETSVSNFCCLLILDGHVTADELVLAALDQVHKQNFHIAKTMLKILVAEYPEEISKKCLKQLNLKFLFSKLEELGHPMNEYNIEVFNNFNQKIIQTKTTQELEKLLIYNDEILDEQKLALASHHIPSLEGNSKTIFKFLSQKFQQIQNDVNDPECLKQFIRGFGLKKQKIDYKTQQSVFGQIAKNICKFNAEQCHSTLHKFALLGIRSHDTVYFFVQKLCEKLDLINIEALSKTIWSLGILGTYIDPKQQKIFERKILYFLDELDERALTQIFFGLANMSWRNLNLLASLCTKAIQLIKNNTIQISEFEFKYNISLKTAVAIFGNLIKFDFMNGELYEVLNEKIQNNIEDVYYEDFVYFFSSFGYVEKSRILKNSKVSIIFQKTIDQLKFKYLKLNKVQLLKILSTLAYTKFEFIIDQTVLMSMVKKLQLFKSYSPYQALDFISSYAYIYKKQLLVRIDKQIISLCKLFINNNSEKQLNCEQKLDLRNALRILKS